MDDCGLLPRYSGNPVGLQGEGLSCDQFCAIVESQIETFKWSDNEAFSHVLQAFTSPAMEWAFTIKDFHTWTQLKMAMKAKFMGKMTIQMKAELRKNLKQSLEESVNDFYDRCKEAEKLICDELLDTAFERDVLLTFLIGLREDLQLKVMASEASCDLNDFLKLAIKMETNNKGDQDDQDNDNAGDDIKPELSDFEGLDPMELDEEDDDNDDTKDLLNLIKSEEIAETEHKCTHCDIAFKTDKQLKSHIKSEHSEPVENIEKLKCSTCSATFRTSRMLRLHIYKNHTENSQYSCQTCSQDFYDLKKFVLHQIKYHAERNGDHIYCLACRRPYTKSHSLQVRKLPGVPTSLQKISKFTKSEKIVKVYLHSILPKPQHFHEFFTQIFFDNFSREIKVVKS